MTFWEVTPAVLDRVAAVLLPSILPVVEAHCKKEGLKTAPGVMLEQALAKAKALDANTKTTLLRRVFDGLAYGQHDAAWLSFYDFVDQELKRPEAAKLRPMIQLADHANWWLPLETFAVISRKPVEQHLNERNRLSSRTRPAIRYADGFKVYAVDNMSVPAWIIETPEQITVEKIDGESNAELRRLMRELYGDGRYLVDSGAEIVDTDYEGAIPGAAPRMLLRDKTNQLWLVGTDGSTGRVYYMPLPTDSTIKTAKAAHEELCGFDESRIKAKS